MQRTQVYVPNELHDCRIDMALVRLGLGLSRKKIRRVIDLGGVYVNSQRVRFASKQVQSGNKIELVYLEAAAKKIRNNFQFSAKDILFENDCVIVINKPPGLASQATRDQSVQHVVPVLQKFLTSRSGNANNELPILVHRLDKETSGVMILAKDNHTNTLLTNQFRAREIGKEYHAICHGTPERDSFDVECHLSSIMPKTGNVVKVNSGGKYAVTHFESGEKNRKHGVFLMRCFPKTGRSHQIRVHLLLSGLPIVGDKRYSDGLRLKPLPDHLVALSARHHFLHCAKMQFTIYGEQLEVSSPYPANFKKFLELSLIPSAFSTNQSPDPLSAISQPERHL